jgi:hypothetical protein
MPLFLIIKKNITISMGDFSTLMLLIKNIQVSLGTKISGKTCILVFSMT